MKVVSETAVDVSFDHATDRVEIRLDGKLISSVYILDFLAELDIESDRLERFCELLKCHKMALMLRSMSRSF